MLLRLSVSYYGRCGVCSISMLRIVSMVKLKVCWFSGVVVDCVCR